MKNKKFRAAVVTACICILVAGSIGVLIWLSQYQPTTKSQIETKVETTVVETTKRPKETTRPETTTVKETTQVETTVAATEAPAVEPQADVYYEEPYVEEVPTTEAPVSAPQYVAAPETTAASEPAPAYTITNYGYYTDQDAVDIAKVMYLEARGIASDTEKACIAWTILNRVDNWGSTIYSVIRQPNQFAFYENTPVWTNLLNLSYDVLTRWASEKSGAAAYGTSGRVLPPEYMWYYGDGAHNYFKDSCWGGASIWNYSWSSPYAS